MYTSWLMLKDLIFNGKVHWFLLFFIFIFVRWFVVYINSVRYKPYTNELSKKLFASVIVPVVDEPLDLFENVITRMIRQKPDEIIIVVNGPKNTPLMKLSHKLRRESDCTIKVRYTPIGSKRNAIKVAMKNVDKKSDISVLVDSDTIWTKDTLAELLKPFEYNDIGGVTTRQKILKPNRNLIVMFANLLEEIRAEGTMKAMSFRNKVGCLPGRTIAFRTEILQKCLHDFMNEEFLGIHKEISDDRCLTNLTLKMGYKTVMQDTSVVYTDAPEKLRQFIKQQLRWSEGSQYNNVMMTPWMAKNNKLCNFIYWSDMLLPFLLLSVFVNWGVCQYLIYNYYNIHAIVYQEPLWMLIILIFGGSALSLGVRNVKVLSNLPWYYTLLLPFIVLFLTFVMMPIRLIGLSRIAKITGWGTRNV